MFYRCTPGRSSSLYRCNCKSHISADLGVTGINSIHCTIHSSLIVCTVDQHVIQTIVIILCIQPECMVIVSISSLCHRGARAGGTGRPGRGAG